MTAIRRILITTDFSDCSKEALQHAIYLARQLDAELYLLHVFEPPVYTQSNLPTLHPSVRQWIDDLRMAESRKFDAMAKEVGQEGIKLNPLFKEGTPFITVLQTAEAIQADLIVLGTHGRTGLDRLLMGSVAERVVRQAPCPVFIVRPKGHIVKEEKGDTR